jgi:hypothetical protein
MDHRSLIAVIVCATLLPAAELPVRTVVLYKHGVGYFERAGTLGAGESARLDFKAAEMNDVLKSLTINDNGGKVTGVRYDSNVPLEQKLGEFPFRLANGQPLSAVLDQLKGARLEMEFGPQKTAGEIVSARMVAGDKDRAEHEQLTLLMDSGELRNVDLSAASSIRFTDTKLQLQFRDYLTALTDSRSKDKRSVYIDSTDTKSRDVRAEYIMPMPAWKSSYRLMFIDSGKDAGKDPVLEGWAIVDNTTGEDWTNVHISLISGKPISFISQLYDPKYIARLSADLPEDQAVAPTVYTGAVTGGVAGGRIGGLASAPPPPERKAFAALKDRDALVRQPNAGLTLGEQMGLSNQTSTFAATGNAAEIADLFQYSIANPVTVKKNESAMLPFLQQKIAARKLIVYSDTSKANPLNAAELTNNTGKTLDGGPITVYDSGAYAGEALVETVKNGDKRFISYGVDLGTRIGTKLNSQTDDIREIHAHNGILTTLSALVQKQTYTIRNVDPRAKTLVIEYNIRPNFKLIDTAAPMETTRDVYRFEVKVPAAGNVEFPVTEENVYSRQTEVSSLTPDSMLIYIRNKVLTEAARKQLEAISDLKTRIATANSDRNRLDTDVQNVTRDEDRNRQNIASLSGVSGQQQIVQDYARKLADQETQIARLRERQTDLDNQRASLQAQLTAAIAKLDF